MQQILADGDFKDTFNKELGNFKINMQPVYEFKVTKFGKFIIYDNGNYPNYTIMYYHVSGQKIAKFICENTHCTLTIYANDFIYEFISTYNVPDYSYVLSINCGILNYDNLIKVRPYKLELSNSKVKAFLRDNPNLSICNIFKQHSYTVNDLCLLKYFTIIKDNVWFIIYADARNLYLDHYDLFVSLFRDKGIKFIFSNCHVIKLTNDRLILGHLSGFSPEYYIATHIDEVFGTGKSIKSARKI